jgi:hypothetical protein
MQTSDPAKQSGFVKLKDRNGATGSERPQNSVAFMLLRLGGGHSSINHALLDSRTGRWRLSFEAA